MLPLLIAAALLAAQTAAGSSSDADVRAAIEEAVRARMGEAATVVVEDLAVRRAPVAANGDASSALKATPDAGARVGGPVRFLLSETGAGLRAPGSRTTGPRRVGSVDATVRVTARHVRIVRPVARGAVITQADVVEVVDDLGRVAFEPLPVLVDVVGAAARRALAAGALVQRHTIAAAPLVRSGDEVTTIVRVGSLEARGRAVSAETAARGEIVRIVSNRRNLRGRVVGAGEVEIER
jgi:flagellar basal body P-ring formation protein FlgA